MRKPVTGAKAAPAKAGRSATAVADFMKRYSDLRAQIEGLQRQSFQEEAKMNAAHARLCVAGIDPKKLLDLYKKDPEEAVAYVDDELAAMDAQADAIATEVEAALSEAETTVAELQSAIRESA